MRVYTLPECEQENSAYTVTVFQENEPEQVVRCYTAKVGKKMLKLGDTIRVETENMAFCYFDSDFTEPVCVRVTPTHKAKTFRVLPQACGAETSWDGNTLTIWMTKPTNMSVEFDGNIYNNLFVFANALEEHIIQETDRNVRYFAPGIHHPGRISLKAGETLYIAGGAVVYGYIETDGVDTIRIAGRGILDGSEECHDPRKQRKKLICLTHCRDIQMEGVILRDSPCWTVHLDCCNDVDIRNVKQITYALNSDGYDIMSCSNVVIDGVFNRNYDDNISLKASNSRDCTHITMKNSVLWADCAHNMLVGPEATAAEYETHFSDIYFENIDVLEQNEESDFYKGVMALTCTDNSVFSRIAWKDIHIERMSDGRIINFRFSTDYGTYFGKSISDILVADVAYTGDGQSASDVILGMQERKIGSVEIRNYFVRGNIVTMKNHYFGEELGHVDNLVVQGEKFTV